VFVVPKKNISFVITYQIRAIVQSDQRSDNEQRQYAPCISTNSNWIINSYVGFQAASIMAPFKSRSTSSIRAKHQYMCLQFSKICIWVANENINWYETKALHRPMLQHVENNNMHNMARNVNLFVCCLTAHQHYLGHSAKNSWGRTYEIC